MGCIYALPNFYKENFEISIEKHELYKYFPDNILMQNIKQTFKKEKIVEKSICLYKERICILFFSESDQIKAYSILSNIFSEKYFVSCLKIFNIPYWLSIIGAKPIKFGLDLKGGLYLVIRVDMKSIFNKLQDEYVDILKFMFFDKKIPYLKILGINDCDIKISFKNSDYRNQAIILLSKVNHNLIFNYMDDCDLRVSFSKKYIRSMHEYAIQQNSTILRNRINQLKISDPLIYRYGVNCIAIELPGIQDPYKIKSIFNNTASLEFRLVNTKINKFKINNNLISKDSEIKLDHNNNIIPLYKKAILTGNHIINSNINFDEYHRPQVNIVLDKFGNEIISKFTKDNIGQLIATLFIEYKDTGKKDSQGHSILYKHDRVINVATIQSQLTRNFCITGINNLQEARHLSSLLRMGSLVAPICIEEEKIIGPMLGKKNINQGMIACVLGIVSSILFMIIWYRYFGLIAGISLILNLALMISIISLIPAVTLTMPSIASIVLTLSVAIDANVLINERIKEEIKKNKPIQYAIYIGYKKAFSSIFDANVTTIITSIILYIYGTGLIQGFAIITIIGVGTSMFTSVLGTRAVINLIYGNKNINKLSI